MRESGCTGQGWVSGYAISHGVLTCWRRIRLDDDEIAGKLVLQPSRKNIYTVPPHQPIRITQFCVTASSEVVLLFQS
jgi:hypothetical protein